MQLTGGMVFGSFQPVTPSDSTLITCRALYVNCTVAGNIVLNSAQSGAGGTTFPISTGTFVLPLGLEQGRVMSTGLTATATIVALA